MVRQRFTLLNNLEIRTALEQAWKDSQPSIEDGHEEGGFILLNAASELSVVRWPQGEHNRIVLPPHRQCKLGESDIVATFHTHPNTGSNFLQEPSTTDKRSVRDDPDLKGAFYEGEFVISQEKIYLISPNGQVSEIGDTGEILKKNNGGQS